MNLEQALAFAGVGALAIMAYEMSTAESRQKELHKKAAGVKSKVPRLRYNNIRDWWQSSYFKELVSLQDAESRRKVGIYGVPRNDIILPGVAVEIPMYTYGGNRFFK
jgi:hypothetical protein